MCIEIPVISLPRLSIWN